MNSRRRVVRYDDGTVEIRKKYNGQNVLGNLLVCEECGVSFRRRTERGKVVYRCAARIEQGREACMNSPTIEEEWIKREIAKAACCGDYDEEVVREKIDKALVGKEGELKIMFKDQWIHSLK